MDDLIDGLIRLMDSPADFHGPVNLGNPVEFTIKELAEMVVEQTGSSSSLDYAPAAGRSASSASPTSSLAQAKLGWEPKVALETGLTPTIAYFAKRLTLELTKVLRSVVAV